MTNIEQFIEYLQGLPKTTEINVLKKCHTLDFMEDTFSFEDLDLNENTEFFAEDRGGPAVLYLGED